MRVLNCILISSLGFDSIDLISQAVKGESFYETTSLLYRLFYITPVFFNFRMRMYIGFVLSECSCIAFGLGAYPTSSEPRSGSGPSKFDKLKEL